MTQNQASALAPQVMLAGRAATGGQGVSADLRAAVGPFHVDAVEALVFAGGLDVLLDRDDLAAHRGVDAVLGDEDAPGQSELLAQGTLPEPHRVRICDGGKAVKEHNSVQSHVFKGTCLGRAGPAGLSGGVCLAATAASRLFRVTIA